MLWFYKKNSILKKTPALLPNLIIPFFFQFTKKNRILVWTILSLICQAEALSPARLISSSKTARLNSTVEISVLIPVEKGWHTYWLNPGSIGKPLTINWQVPESIPPPAPLKWPLPQRISYKKWINFGYTGDLTVQSSVFIPADYQKKSLPIQARLSWILCKEICIPFEQTVSLEIPIEKKTALSGNNLKPDPPVNITGKINKTKQGVRIHFYSKEEFELVDFFPLSSLPPDHPKISQKTPFHATAGIPSLLKPPSSSVQALVIFKQNGKKKSTLVHLKNQTRALFVFILMAFIGGLILNIMPCVFPVIFLKFYPFIQENKNKNLISSSLAYSSGIIVSFLLLALFIHLLKENSAFVGWGFQMQSPLFVAGLILLFTFIGFNFLGWFSISVQAPLFKGELKNFLSGFMAVAVASPCTAPFMGSAIGYAFAQSTVSVLVIFTSLGAGMAFPYIVFCFFPHLVKKLPRPGPWNEKLKYSMAFIMLLTVIWLFSILHQLHSSWVYPLILALTGYGCFFQLKKKRGAFFILILSMLLTVYPAFLPEKKNLPDSVWQEFSLIELNQLRYGGQAVILRFTAKWCLTCQLNEWTTWRHKKTIQFLTRNQIILLKGDWTYKNDEIADFLKSHSRAGIPFALFFPPQGRQPVILPTILTPDLVIQKMKTHLK